jgi:hypothetical protein
MLDHFKQTDAPPISPAITFTNFAEGIRSDPKVARKNITLPSGRRLGHYKNLKLRAATSPHANEIMLAHHTMLRLAELRARPFERWCADLEVMLEKNPGQPFLHRLRIICLYEAGTRRLPSRKHRY